MPTNLSSLSSVTTAATALSNLIMVSPQSVVGYAPQNPAVNGVPSLKQNAPALLFHYEGEQTTSLESDITDHYIENNSAVQDQVSLKPVTITTHGFIGELNDVAPFGLQTLKAAATKLSGISAYAPQLSVTALIAYNQAFLAYQVVANAANAAVSAWSSVNNLIEGSDGQSVIGADGTIKTASAQNKQQVMYQAFYGYWQQRTLFTVQTPWAVFQNMAIQKLRSIQNEETRMITDFEITFKQIRTVSTALNGLPVVLDTRASTQASPAVDQGTSSGSPSIGVGEGTAQTEAP
jgi:hypothetical protein